jgi:hypothetical protein
MDVKEVGPGSVQVDVTKHTFYEKDALESLSGKLELVSDLVVLDRLAQNVVALALGKTSVLVGILVIRILSRIRSVVIFLGDRFHSFRVIWWDWLISSVSNPFQQILAMLRIRVILLSLVGEEQRHLKLRLKFKEETEVMTAQ